MPFHIPYENTCEENYAQRAMYSTKQVILNKYEMVNIRIQSAQRRFFRQLCTKQDRSLNGLLCMNIHFPSSENQAVYS